jgi:hypothetical protein
MNNKLILLTCFAFLFIMSCDSFSGKTTLYNTKAKLTFITTAIEIFHAENNHYPSVDEGLSILVKDGDLKTMPKDYWGHDYKFIIQDETPFVYSMGPNGIDDNGLKDDVTLKSLEQTIESDFELTYLIEALVFIAYPLPCIFITPYYVALSVFGVL